MSEGKSKLEASIVSGDVKEFLRLIDEGCSVDQTFPSSFDSCGKNPTFLACEHGSVQVLELLLKRKVSLSPLSDRFTPLMAVCSTHLCDQEDKLVQCAKLLLNHGVDPNEYQSQQITALMFASKYGKTLLVELLVQHPGLKLDAQDSQKFTSLLYAVNAEHGDIARKLLEAGANPDIPSRDGTLAADLAASKNMPTLQSIIKHFSKIEGIPGLLAETRISSECITFSEVDNILLGLDAKDFIQSFKHHQVGIQEFLVLNEDDLVQIGVSNVGVRKKILEAIADINKRDWENSSLPQVKSKDKSRGIYLSVVDATCIMANISNHLNYINTNVAFIDKQINSKPELLKLGTDTASVQLLASHLVKTKGNMMICNKSINKLQLSLRKYENQKEFENVDTFKIYEKPKPYIPRIALVTASLVIVGAVVFYRRKF